MPTPWNHALPNTEKTGTVTTTTSTVPPTTTTTNGWWWWWVAGAVFIIFLLIIIALVVYWNRPSAPTIYTDECGNIIGTSSTKKDNGLVCQAKCPPGQVPAHMMAPVPVPANCSPCGPPVQYAPQPVQFGPPVQYAPPPPVQYAPPPVQYAPPPVQYAPQPM